MAKPVAGAKSTIGVPFPVGEKRAHADHDYSGLLGQEIVGDSGNVYRLVRLDNASGLTRANCEKLLFEYSDQATFDVDKADGSGDRLAGLCVEDQDDLDDNDYFWLQVDGRGVGISSAAITKGDQLKTTSAGKLVTDATYAEGVTELIALEAASGADEDVDVQFKKKVRG